MQRCLWLALFVVLGTCTVLAQEIPTPSGPQTLTFVMDQRLAQAEKVFVAAVEAMPDDKFSFAPTNGEFKGVRTFAQQVKHVAATNYLFSGAMLGEKPVQYHENGPDDLKNKAEIIKYLKDSFASMHKAFTAMNEKNAVEPIVNPFGGKPWTRLGTASLEVGHIFDHYGQMVEYLRMNGIIPPASRQ